MLKLFVVIDMLFISMSSQRCFDLVAWSHCIAYKLEKYVLNKSYDEKDSEIHI